MTLKNLLFEEQTKLVCTLKHHRKKWNGSSAFVFNITKKEGQKSP